MTLVEIAELLGFGISAVLMAGLFVAAILRIGVGVYGLVRMYERPTDLASVLKGIEYLFLAPLVLLAYVSMLRFVRGHFPQTLDPPRWFAPTEMAHSVKLSLGSLVIAILLTDLAEKALTSGTKDALNLTGECVTVTLGLAYLIVIQRMVHHD